MRGISPPPSFDINFSPCHGYDTNVVDAIGFGDGKDRILLFDASSLPSE